MGALIRAKDWSGTPLGDPLTWPQSLKTLVGVMLDNPFGMYIAWGKDHIQIYNDGYRPILGVNKHPQALGVSTKETYSEIWHIVSPMFDTVMEGKAVSFTDFMLPLNRNGYIEDCYFDFSYSPIRLDCGKVGGILVIITETTAKKKAEDLLNINKNELEFVLEASQLGTFDYNPFTNKFSGNTRLKTWFGLFSDEQIELDLALHAIAPNDRERVSNSIKRALQASSNANFQEEYTIINPVSKEEVIVRAKGRAWFNKEEVAYRLNGTLEDVTLRVLARKKIEESERSLRLMILQAPMAISIFRGEDYRVEIANKYALQLWGKTEEQVLNISVFDSMPELLSQGIKELLDGVIQTGKRYESSELAIQIKKNGVLETVYINFSYEALYDIEGKINGIMAVGYDVSPQVHARKKIEESEQNMRTLVESAPFPIGVFVGEDMLISLANKSIMEAWGKGNDVIGKLYSEILPELEIQHIYDQIRKVLHTGIPFHAKNQQVDIIKNGELNVYYYNYSLTPLRDAEGNVHSVMNTAAEVTELTEARYRIEESEKRFRDSVEQAPLGIVIFRGADHLIEMANESYLQLIGKTEKEFVGVPLFESLPEVRETMAPIIADIYKTGNAFNGYEFPVSFNRNGKTEIGYYNFVYHPLKENNSITGIMVVTAEVTATVKAKQLIEENEEKLNLIIEASNLGVYDIDLKSGKIVAADRYYEILGFKEKRNLLHDEIIGYLHPEDLIIREKAFKEAFKIGLLHYQSRLILEDQSLRWIDVRGKVFYDQDQKPERLLGTVRDITEEKTYQEQLLEREEKFRLLADTLPQHIWTSDSEGNINYFNEFVIDYTGLRMEQIIPDGWLQIVHPDEREENATKWAKAVNTGNDFLLEHRFRNYKGDYRWQLSRAIPQKDKDGNIKMWVGSSTDIQEQIMFTTELENMVQLRTNELQEKNIVLEKMNKELQSFVYISSHDLQEPLRKIQIFASRIMETEQGALSENAVRYFIKIREGAHRMQTLIQDLTAYSRTGVQEKNYEIVDLVEVIEDVQETLSEELGQNKVIFSINNKCMIRIIPVQFKQVIHNLISNSIKFSRVDQPILIDIHCNVVKGKDTGIPALSGEKEYCHIRYADNGIGFGQQYSEKIFEVFQRLHSNDEYMGTGIGLAIVKKIVENHNGIISANSKLNEGATFNIYIPA